MKRLHAATLCSLLVIASCRGRRGRDAQDGPASDPTESTTTPTATNAIVPVRAAEGSQPRWRYLARGARPRGRERWRFDLTPREGLGEPATDGRTVFLTASRQEPEGPTDGEVYAFDLEDGTLRWHTPVEGLHGEPVEVFDGLVVVDTIPHCKRRGAETPGVTTRPCEETAPGGVVGLDAATGRERFRSAASSEALHARWTAALVGTSLWIHDGVDALRTLAPPTWRPGPRIATGGVVLNLASIGGDALFTATNRSGATRVVRRTPGVTRPRWEHPLPLRTRCPPVMAGAVIVLPAFESSIVSGAARALLATDGADIWMGQTAPHSVSTCGAIEGPVHYQVVDDHLVGNLVTDGRRRADVALPVAMTGDASVLMDGVFYVCARGRLAGVDVVGGHVAVSVDTGTASCEGMVVWGGRGVVVTHDPSLVVGFD